MKCDYTDPQCENEAVKAVKITTTAIGIKMRFVCQEHYAPVSMLDGMLPPYTIVMGYPLIGEQRVIATVEDAEMPQEDTKQ